MGSVSRAAQTSPATAGFDSWERSVIHLIQNGCHQKEDAVNEG